MKNTVKITKDKSVANSNKTYPDYQKYPANEDIYNRDKKEAEIDPEDISKVKPTNANVGKFNEKTFNLDKSGDDLDIPGAELDDEQENIGSEDEENNGYSIGSDNHNNLEEDNG